MNASSGAPPGDHAAVGDLVVSVDSGKYSRLDLPVTVVFDSGELNGVDPIGLLEVDSAGDPIAPETPWQFDGRDGGGGTLVFMLTGTTAAETVRRYRIRLGSTGPVHGAVEAPLQVDDEVSHQSQASIRVASAGRTWYYHKHGAGFASLYDRDENDWISYRPEGGASGNYRGVPNLVYPEGYFHPGGMKCETRLIASGPLCARIESTAEDGAWAVRWEIYPRHARLTVLRAPKPFWVLYEGTPGGRLDTESDRVVRSTGETTPASEPWTGPLPDLAWAGFVDGASGRMLYLCRHETYDGLTDSYWPMQEAMTVFGFGRNKLEHFHTRTPARFTVGLIESEERDAAGDLICGAVRDPEVSVDPEPSEAG